MGLAGKIKFSSFLTVRTIDSWLLMGSPIPLVVIFTFYLLFVLKIGPNFMKDRKAFSLKTSIFFYNLFQVFASTAIVVKVKS